MENKVEYTEDEINQLLDNLTKVVNPIDAIELPVAIIRLNIGGQLVKRRIPLVHLRKVLKTGDFSFLTTESGCKRDVLCLLKHTLLNAQLFELPLLLNEAPEIVKWRLKIGK